MHPSLFLIYIVAAQTAASIAGPARTPTFSSDGRMAIAVDGDLWVSSGAAAAGPWTRVTSGSAWDREPAWGSDGQTLVFSSDCSGTFNLWRVRVGRDAKAGAPERITTSPEPDGEPTVARDGRIIFVRGRDATARLWMRAIDGTEKRLTKGES